MLEVLEDSREPVNVQVDMVVSEIPPEQENRMRSGELKSVNRGTIL